jgi:hypothetical protein
MEDSDSCPSPAAKSDGRLRYEQGHTPSILIHESRILQVILFGSLSRTLSSLDFSLLLPVIMMVADKVDAQRSEAMTGYMEALNPKPISARGPVPR